MEQETTTPAAESPASAVGAASARSAEARELERQLDEMRDKLRQAEARAQENLDRWQRAQADLANFRRRTQFEREESEKYAASPLVHDLLTVMDSFDRAWQSLPGELRRLTWISGVSFIQLQLRSILDRAGVSEIDATGRPFDPAEHEALEHQEGDGQPHVITVYQAGYRLHQRLLRPALVKVGPKAASDGAAPVNDTAPAAPDATS